MKKFFLVTHRWIGLAAALILALAGASGAFLVWSHSEALADFHTHLLIGEPGEWLVNSSAMAFVLLAIGGAVLWWRRKALAVRRDKGWWRFLFDLHHALGAIGAVLMLVVSLSGLGIMVGEEEGEEGGAPAQPVDQNSLMFRLHTARTYPLPVQVLWAAASASFLVQAVSGFVMWWRPGDRGAEP
jgi:uncharacterized iron-regulated membrane protein